ncbi:hypothetical protein AUJ65_05175 [Candidatus Micrarchaeota archaeon CG1_02_51_15]|nr:MAG: hypothetical protein AUJ65_05175 [Candidatus Micrarchaeota archaeon CG1_02_51_15]
MQQLNKPGLAREKITFQLREGGLYVEIAYLYFDDAGKLVRNKKEGLSELKLVGNARFSHPRVPAAVIYQKIGGRLAPVCVSKAENQSENA